MAERETTGREGPLRYLPRGHALSWVMLVVTFGAILITSIDRILLPTVLPAILKDFRLTAAAGGVLVSFSYVGSTLGGVFLGALGDLAGRGVRRAWLWGLSVAVVVASAIATALTRTLVSLQILRVTMGIGTGSMEPVNVAMIGEWWQKEDRGFAVGAHHTGFPVGQFIGPLLIGAIVATATWRATFLLIPLLAIPIVILQVVISRRANLRRVNRWVERHDLTPSVTEKDLVHPRWTNPLTQIRDAITADRNVALAVAANFLFLWTETGVTSFLTLQLTRNVGLSLAVAATVSGASGLTGWIGQIFWGAVSDHRGRKFSLGILACGITVSILAMTQIHTAALAWIILIGWGLFRNSPYPVLYSAVIDTVPEASSAGLGLMIGIGLGASGIIAAPVAGLIIDHSGFTLDYIVLAAIGAATLIPITLLHDVRRRPAGQTEPAAS